MGKVLPFEAYEYESCWAIALEETEQSLENARQLSHDSLLKATWATRLSGVSWTYWSTDDAPVLHVDGGTIEMPPDVALLCAMAPGKRLVMATVKVMAR
jgi:hypothetical protein